MLVLVTSVTWCWCLCQGEKIGKKKRFTLPETNIPPENGWLEYYFPIGMAYFRGQTVSFRGCKFQYFNVVLVLVAKNINGKLTASYG